MTHGHDGGEEGHHHGDGDHHNHHGGDDHHGGHHHHGGDLIIAPAIDYNVDDGNRREYRSLSEELDEFTIALKKARAETAKTQVFRWKPESDDYNWDSYNPHKFDRVSAFQFTEFVNELRSIPNYNDGKLVRNAANTCCTGMFIIAFGFFFWLCYTVAVGPPSMQMNYGLCAGFLITMIIIIASQLAADKKKKTKRLAMERVVQEWNTKCFYPANYSLAADSKNDYFILTNNDNGPQNVVNIVAPPPVMGGYPGIPSGYAPG